MAAGDLTDVASVKAWLNLPNDIIGSDGLLGSLVTSASAYVVSWLSRDVLSAAFVEIYDGNGKDYLVLANGPITAVTSVAWAGTTLSAAGDPVAPTAGYFFSGRKLSLVGYRFPYGARVKVSYTAGYATVPADLKQAVTEIVGEAFKRRDRIGVTSKSLTGGVGEVISFSQADITANAKTLLMQYRNVIPL